MSSLRNTAMGRLHTAMVAVALTTAFAAPEAFAQRGGARNQQTFNVLPMSITSVTVVNGQLVANGLLGTTPFQAPITLTPEQAPTPGACPILNLSLAPINLSLLGLNVDTSAICLDITAQQGGGLLGNLLCGVANLLNGGLNLGQILGQLSPAQLATLTNGLTQLLNQVFARITSSQAVVGATTVANATSQVSAAATCEILNLAVGPLDLNLLGLAVALDNCADGPVTVAVTATEGGGLLGDLLCSLNNLLNPTATGNPNAIMNALTRIAQVIGGIVG